MPPRYAFRLEDLRVFHLVRAHCHACGHKAVIANAALLQGRPGYTRMMSSSGSFAPIMPNLRTKFLIVPGCPVHPHMLRHACGFTLANNGQDTRALQHYLGHRNIQHTVRYTASWRQIASRASGRTGPPSAGGSLARISAQTTALVESRRLLTRGCGRYPATPPMASAGGHWSATTQPRLRERALVPRQTISTSRICACPYDDRQSSRGLGAETQVATTVVEEWDDERWTRRHAGSSPNSGRLCSSPSQPLGANAQSRCAPARCAGQEARGR